MSDELARASVHMGSCENRRKRKFSIESELNFGKDFELNYVKDFELPNLSSSPWLTETFEAQRDVLDWAEVSHPASSIDDSILSNALNEPSFPLVEFAISDPMGGELEATQTAVAHSSGMEPRLLVPRGELCDRIPLRGFIPAFAPLELQRTEFVSANFYLVDKSLLEKAVSESN